MKDSVIRGAHVWQHERNTLWFASRGSECPAAANVLAAILSLKFAIL